MSLKLKLTAFFFPERCPFCGKIIDAEDIACAVCLEHLTTYRTPISCGVNGFRCISSFVYGGKVRKMLTNVKFYERIQHIRQVAEILAQDIRDEYGEDSFDLITCVPMHPKDMEVRGYNQSEILAKELGRLLNLPFVETLEKIKRTKKQHQLQYKERLKNLNGVFRIIDKDAVRGKRILIVDDIVTTGTTLGKCCQALNRSKPKRICCAAIANAGMKHINNIDI